MIRAIDNAIRLGRALRDWPPAVGPTPADTVFRENKWRLLRYRGAPTARTPVLLVPSLINRSYVLDLIGGRSLIEYLVGRGHPVYCVDWGTPGDEDRYLDLDDVVAGYIGRALRRACADAGSERAHLLGYCLGGTLTAAYTAAFPDRVATLTAMAAPVDFDRAGIMVDWVRTPSFDLEALASIGNLPWPLMQAAFHCLRPTLKLAKLVMALDKADDPEFLASFLALERWGSDNVSFPGEVYRRYIGELYRENRLFAGELAIAGARADLAAITCPLHVVCFEGDHIVPEASALALADRVGSKDVSIWCKPGGHVSSVIARSARRDLWPALSDFWLERDKQRHPVAARVAS